MKIKFNLGWILAIAAAIVLAAMGFMSFYYRTGGSLVLPIIIAVCLLVLPIVVNMYLVPAKECPKPFYFHKEAVKEVSLLAVMIILFLASMPLVNHFFTVNSRTSEIAAIVADQRRQLDEMQESYSKHIDLRTANYRAYLKEVLDNKDRDIATYNRVFPNGSNDIDLMVRDMHNKISLEGLNDSVATVYGNETIGWWQLPSVMNNVDNISTALERNYNLMVQRDHNVTDDMAQNDYWSFEYATAEDIMALFVSKKGFVSSLWSVLAVLLAYLLIMLPYIVAERDTRHKGLFYELRKEDDDEDDNTINSDNIGVL